MTPLRLHDFLNFEDQLNWRNGFDRATFNTALTGTQNGILAEYRDFPPGGGGGGV